MRSFSRLNELLDKFIDMGVPFFDIEVRYNGEKVFRRMYGYSDYEKKQPVNGKELYEIYSCSKPITCAAALTLLEKGKLSLSDKLSDYLPEFKKMTVYENGILREAKKPITIEDLFTMTAGFTYDVNTENIIAGKNEIEGAETREMMRYLAKDPLVFEPSERFNYSLCHDVLAAVVQVIAGESFGEYIKKAVFDKAGMENTTYLPDKISSGKLAAQYIYDSETGEYKKLSGNFSRFGNKYESGGAGCITCVDDYMKFLEGLRIGDVFLSKETIKLMTASRLPVSKLKEYPLFKRGYGYGLGLRCPLDEKSLHTDFGWGGAAAAYAAFDIKHSFYLYYAQHVLNSPNQELRNELPGIVRECLGFSADNAEYADSDGYRCTY